MDDATVATVIQNLAKRCQAASEKAGWYEERDAINAFDKSEASNFPAGSALQKRFIERHTHNSVPVVTKLMLIVSEVSEAMEVIRRSEPDSPRLFVNVTDPVTGKMEGLPSELADIIIRTFELAVGLDIDIGSAIMEKMSNNAGRSYRHGSKRF